MDTKWDVMTIGNLMKKGIRNTLFYPYEKFPLYKYAAFIALFLPSILLAGQTVIQSYDDAHDNYFYDKLYINNIGESLYCGITRPIGVGGGRSLEQVPLRCPDAFGDRFKLVKKLS